MTIRSMKTELLAAALALTVMSAGPALAVEEPFGAPLDGWRFTQEGDARLINCRAWLGTNLMAMRTNGSTYVSTSANGLPQGKDEEANITVAGTANLVQTASGGQGGRLLFTSGVDRVVLEQIVRARGYSWATRLQGKSYSGRVAFNASTDKAYSRLRECVRANGGK